MFKSPNRGLAAAAHVARLNQRRAMAPMAKQKEDETPARLNQRRAMASMAKQKEDEMTNWSCDEVSWCAQSVIPSKVFIHAFKAEE